MDRILVSGLRVMGVHGVLAEEQERPQPFGVELELLVDLAPAGASDVLADTVDYGTLIEAVSRIVSDEHYQLIERLATRIAETCRADERGGGSSKVGTAGEVRSAPRGRSHRALREGRARVPCARLESR
jgi:dihydroneopterin aldolase